MRRRDAQRVGRYFAVVRDAEVGGRLPAARPIVAANRHRTSARRLEVAQLAANSFRSEHYIFAPYSADTWLRLLLRPCLLPCPVMAEWRHPPDSQSIGRSRRQSNLERRQRMEPRPTDATTKIPRVVPGPGRPSPLRTDIQFRHFDHRTRRALVRATPASAGWLSPSGTAGSTSTRGKISADKRPATDGRTSV